MCKKGKGFDELAKGLWGKDLVVGQDAKDLTYQVFREGVEKAAIVILSPEGKILWRGADPKKGNYFYSRPGRPKMAYADLKENMEPHLDKGLLGGLTVPVQGRPVEAAIKLGDLAQARLLLNRLKGDGGVAEFKDELTERLEALGEKKRASFDALMAAGKIWDAYKVGSSYARCFPKAEGAKKVKSDLRSLKSKPEVRDNLKAQKTFIKTVALAYGPTGKPEMKEKVGQALEKMAGKYSDTEFGVYAAKFTR